ncbi:Protein of uncharacterised function (DUF2752) [uncultured Clostridium sp.]|nr:Protein of uncharacterised function (DUF2752) [uncultured Clostridium sp.]
MIGNDRKMNWKKTGRRIREDAKWAFLTGIVFFVYYEIVHYFYGAFCPMLVTTGFPCAGCGLTRAFLYLGSGQLERAMYMNPMALFVIVFALYCGYYRYIRLTTVKHFSLALGLLITVMLVFYGVRMYLYFPDRVPYVYTRRNVLAECFPGYQQLVDQLLNRIRENRVS